MSKDAFYGALEQSREAMDTLYNKAKDIIYEQEIELNQCKEILRTTLDFFNAIQSCKYARCEQCKYLEGDISDPTCPEKAVFKWKYADEVMKLLGVEDNDQ